MGITGLLPFLKNIQKDVHISAFKGMKVGVDAYCWLHKGVYSCSTQIVMKTAKIETLPFINYCMRRVNLLRQLNITPIIVFDGGRLPTKAKTEKERRDKRKAYLTKGKELLKLGKTSEARDCFQKSVDISPEIALAFIKECRKLGVECIVAPYEADAQLAFLSKEGIVDLVISEDSDLLVFGSHKVLFKMDESGYGKLIELKDLAKANKVLVGFTPTSFRHVCILSGCDYLSSIHGVGLVKAAKLMRRHNQNPTQVIRALRCDSSSVPDDYENNFKKADETFLYQLVYDPRTHQQVRLHPLPTGLSSEEFKFAGMEHSPRKAVLMARGNIDPITLEVLDQYSPSKSSPGKVAPAKSTSWSGSAMGSANKNYPISIQAKLPITSSEKASRPFKAPSSVLTSRRIAAGGSSDVEEDEKEEDIMAMYASKGSDNAQKGVKKGLLGLYHSESGNGLKEETQSSQIDSIEPQVTLSRFFPCETVSNSCSSNTTVSDSCDNQAPDDSSSSSVDSNIISVARSADCKPRKRLFNCGRLNVFAFSKKRQRLDESIDSGVEMSHSLSSSGGESLSQSEGNQGGSRLHQATIDSNLPDGGLPTEPPESRIASLSCSILIDDDSAARSHSLNSSLRTEEDFCRTLNENTQASSSGISAVEQSMSACVDPTPVTKLMEEEKDRNVSVGVVKAPSTVLKAKNNKLDNRRMSLPCTRSKRVGLSKNSKPPRLSDPGHKQMQLSAFCFSRKPQLKL